MKRLLFSIILLFAFFFPVISFSSYIIEINAPSIVYDWENKTIKADEGIILSYDNYQFSGKSMYMDLKREEGKIVSGCFTDGKVSYFGDISFKKDYLRLREGKVFTGNSPLFGAETISLYPEKFISATNLTFYSRSGAPIFGIPYFSKLFIFPEHTLFPIITISDKDIAITSFIDYYSPPSSFGFFTLNWKRSKGTSILWTHYVTDTFGIYVDYDYGQPYCGLTFRGPLELSLSSNFSANVKYTFHSGCIEEIYLDYNYMENGKTELGTKLSFPIGNLSLYSGADYILTEGKWSSFKMGVSSLFSPFKINIDYDVVKKEVGLALYLDIATQ